jgi:HSP20 family protein
MRLTHRPQIDVFRTENPAALTLMVEIPGADPDAMKIVLDGRRLLIAGERERPRVEGQWYRSEIEYGPFEREVSLAFDVNVEEASASYRRGLLRIVLPVAERPPEPVRVSIEVLRTR